MSWDGPSGPIELRAPHGTPPHPHSARVPFLTLDCVGLCWPPLPATHGPAQTHSQVQDPADPPAELVRLPPRGDAEVQPAAAGAGPRRCGDRPTPGVGFWVLGRTGECGTEQGVPGSCAFQPSFTQTFFDLGKTLDLWAQPLKWGSGLHANSVP